MNTEKNMARYTCQDSRVIWMVYEYMNIGSWWERKKGKEANEIDIVGIKVDDKTAVVAEVKRQRRNYDHKLFMEKVERIKSCLLMKYDVETKLLTLEDM